MSDLTAVSLFAGIGGFDEALRRSGVRVVAAVEIDPACRAVLRRHFPQAAIFDDVTEVTGDQLRAAGFVPGRGILCGGFPCQDLSVAGRRAGLGGSRSGLFWHIMRLADELRPRWLFLENVPGLLSAVCSCPGDDTCTGSGQSVRCGEYRGDGERREWFPNVPHAVRGGACATGCMAAHGGAMGTVLGAVGERGYGFAYRVLDAQFFGVPQRRRRVFIAGCLGDGAAPVQVLLEPESGGGNPAPVAAARPATSPAARDGAVSALQGGGRRGHRIDAEGAAGGHLVAIPVQDGREIVKAQNGTGIGIAGDPAYTLDITGAQSVIAGAMPIAWRGRDGGSQLEAGADGDPMFALRASKGGGTAGMPLVCTLGGEGVDHALTSEGADASEDGTGRGTPVIAYALTSHHNRDSDSDSGQTYIPLDMRNAARESEAGETAGTGIGADGDPSFTLSAEHRAIPGIASGTQVRRLTPLECERLQGFPDDWTRWLDDGTEQSDSARYRELGNAVAVPVAEWIARRVAAIDGLAAAEGAA